MSTTTTIGVVQSACMPKVTKLVACVRGAAACIAIMALFANSADIATAAATAATPPVNGFISIDGTPEWVRGVNLPWLDGAYDHDIGINPNHPSWGCAYNSAHVNNYMADMHRMNANVVRIWLFEGEQGLTTNSSNQITGLDPTFLTNLDNIVSLAAANHLHCYFTLLNDIESDGNTPGEYTGILNNSTDQLDYIDNAVIPLVNRYKGSSSIFAFDINNEIESQVTGDTGNWTTSGITWTQAQAYISAVASAVHATDPTRLCTCTSGWHNWDNVQSGLFTGLGLDFYDCHAYIDGGGIPTAASLNLDKPVILGEFGQASSTVDDTIDNNTINGFVSEAINTGWAGCAKWAYDYPGAVADVFGMLEQASTQTDLIWRPGTQTLSNYYHENIDGDTGGFTPYTFAAGLQMISMPDVFDNMPATNIMSPNPPMVAWDAQDATYEVEPVQPADAYRIGYGYWVRVPTGGASLIFSDPIVPGTATSVQLYPGWNIIGDPYSSAEPESSMAIQVGAAASESLAQAVTDGTIATTLYTYSPGATAYTAQDASGSLQPFIGYWIYTNADCTLTYSDPS